MRTLAWRQAALLDLFHLTLAAGICGFYLTFTSLSG